MTRQDGSGRPRKDEDLERLKFAANTADEAARWLRNSLARVRTGHEVEFEILSAEQALQAALERMGGEASEGGDSDSAEPVREHGS
ncbi:MAG TPA: hypothetical protein VFU33_03450 [Gaiellaceae bacterium]|nr:hypothetical protein [Gaiellaceae bacterium]